MTLEFSDVWGNKVSLTEERRSHLLEHPEMIGYEDEIGRTLSMPDVVVQSRSDPAVRLFHRLYKGLAIGDKHLCVVVKYGESNTFVITAYFTDKVKSGEALWTK